MDGQTTLQLDRCPGSRITASVSAHQRWGHSYALSSSTAVRRGLPGHAHQRDYGLQPDQFAGLVPPVPPPWRAGIGGWPCGRQPRQIDCRAAAAGAHLLAPIYAPSALRASRCNPTGEFWTVPDLKRAVHQWFGVTWNSHSSSLALLAACEFSYQRTPKVFKSRREREIMAFEESLEKN